MLRYTSSANIPAFIANGAGDQFVINCGSWLGGVADIYAAHNGDVFGGVAVNGVSYRGGKLDNTSTLHQFEPRVSVRKWSRLTPFCEMLMGADAVKGSVPLRLPPGQTTIVALSGGSLIVNGGCASAKNVYVRASSAQTASAYKLGGGMDLELNRPCLCGLSVLTCNTRVCSKSDIHNRTKKSIQLRAHYRP